MANEVKFKLAIEGFEAVKDKLDRVEQRLGGLAGAIGKMSHIGAALYAIPTALNSTVGSAIRAADAITTLNTQLLLATGSAAQASKAYNALFDIAQQSRVSFTELGTTFAAVSRAGREMGVSQERLLVVTQSISQAMTIGGGSAASMNAALVQLGQGLSSGVLRGEELNSIMEQTPRLAKAIADGLGVPIGKLRELGAAGQLTSEQVIAALERSGPQLAKEMASAALTVGQSLTMMGNSAANFIGQVDQAVGLSSKVAQAMQYISQSMDGVSKSSAAMGFLTNDFQAAGEAMDAAKRRGSGFFSQFNQGMGMLIGRATAMQYLSRDFMTLDQTVASATATISRLDAQEQKFGKLSIYSMSERAIAVRDLARANRELADSQPGPASNSYAKEDAKLAAHTAAWKMRQADEAAFSKAGEAYLSTAQKNQKLLNDEIEKNSALLDKGSITAAQYSERINAVRASFEKKVASTGLTEAAKALALYDDLLAKPSGFNADFAEKWILLSKAKVGTEALTTAQAALLALQPAAQAAEKLRIDLAKENTKAVDDLFDAQEKLRLTNEEQIKTGRTLLEQIEFETRLLGMNAEQRAIATMERDLEAKGIIKGTQAYEAYITKLREAMAIKTGKEAGIKAADDLADANKKAAEESSKYWEDSLMRAFESGKGFFQSLWDTIKNTLKTQVLKVTVQGIMGTMGIGASGAAAAGGSGGGTLGAAANLSTLYNSLAGGVNVAMQSGVALAGLAAKAGSQMVAGFAGGMVSTASMASASAAASAGGSAMAGLIAGSVMNGLAGYGISKGLSGGYSIDGLNVNAIAGIASMIPGVGPIAGLIGAAVNRAFGHGATEVQAQGTRGTFAASGDFSGTNYTNYKQAGGWFTQDKHWSDTSAVDQKQITAWSDAFVSIKAASAGMAATLGLATDKIAAYSKSVDVAAGTTAEQMTALFVGMADDMATAAAPGLEMLARVGETASVTLGRLSSSLVTVNQWLGVLDHSLLTVSLIGADFASQLADTFGGMDKLTTASKAYYDSFWTDAERLADTATNVAKSLALVGQAMPASKEAFRAVVSGLDLTTAAGRSTYAVMLALAPEFSTVADAVVSMTNSLTAEAKRIRALMAGDTPASYSQAQAAFAIGTAQARAGDATALQTLPALSQALLMLAQANAVTSADLARVRGATAGSLETTAGMAAASFGLTLPSFDVGTNRVPRDMIAMIHEGEAIIPRPFNPQTFGSGRSGGASSDAVVAELRALRQDNTAMRAELRAIAEHASKTSRILSRVTRDGESMQTVAG